MVLFMLASGVLQCLFSLLPRFLSYIYPRLNAGCGVKLPRVHYLDEGPRHGRVKFKRINIIKIQNLGINQPVGNTVFKKITLISQNQIKVLQPLTNNKIY